MQITPRLHAFLWDSMTANNCNTYFIDGPTRILIDPGHTAHFDHVLHGLDQLGVDLADIGLIICTHAHPDHIEAVQLFKDLQALTAIHVQDWSLAKQMEEQIHSLLKLNLDDFAPDFFLSDGELHIEDLVLKVIHSPGHSPGSIALYWPEEEALITGDVLFEEGVGRTDLPGGNGKQLKESIDALSQLNVATLLPGHGPLIQGKNNVKLNFKQLQQVWFQYI
jgi:glyoxylase-like metal-dependent hydrolase (beta-lactamase superfamily II)